MPRDAAALRDRPSARALLALAASSACLAAGLVLAARAYPGGFDWPYTVMSALASRKHNPEGSTWFALGLALGLGALWPAVSRLRERDTATVRLARWGARALRAGIAFGVLVGVERLVFHHLSDILRKGHELLALASFVGLYAGVLALHVDRARRRRRSALPAALVAAPLVAIGLSQLALYLDPRDLGWVGPEWRDLGVPVWKSFAFWQWAAAAALWTSIAHLVLTSGARGGRGDVRAGIPLENVADRRPGVRSEDVGEACRASRIECATAMDLRRLDCRRLGCR